MNGSGGNALAYLVGTLIDLYVAAVLLRLLLQWVRADFYNPLCRALAPGYPFDRTSRYGFGGPDAGA
jgi:YggT family protein